MLATAEFRPPASVAPLLTARHRRLTPGGRLLVRDVRYRARYKRWFTWTLDGLMAPRPPRVTYWPPERLQDLLESVGFVVYHHQMVDILPYPHGQYICERRAGGGVTLPVYRASETVGPTGQRAGQ